MSARAPTPLVPTSGLRYQDLRLLSSTPGFSVFSARDERDEQMVVVRPQRRADPERAVECLRRLAASHARIEHPLVPSVARSEFDGEHVHVALRVAAMVNGFDVATRLALRASVLPYATADGFVLSLREALEAAHRATEGPHCLGRVSLANVLFDVRGQHYLFGFGHNVAVNDEHGRPDPRVRAFQAPELLVSPEPTPMTDYVALLLLARSIVIHVDLPPMMKRVIAGNVTSLSERLLARLLRFTEQRVIAELPSQRPSFAEAIRVAEQLRKHLGLQPERNGFAKIARALLAEEVLPSVGPGVWVLASDVSWIERDGQRIRLAGPGRAILVALLDRLLWGTDPNIDVWQLYDCAWPGESVSYERGMNRVHATVSRLRRAGLASLIEHSSKGYRLAATADVVRLPDPALL